MQSVSSRIWTRVAVSISYDDNHYTAISYDDNHYNTGTSTHVLIYSAIVLLVEKFRT